MIDNVIMNVTDGKLAFLAISFYFSFQRIIPCKKKIYHISYTWLEVCRIYPKLLEAFTEPIDGLNVRGADDLDEGVLAWFDSTENFDPGITYSAGCLGPFDPTCSSNLAGVVLPSS
jgi:hypothetical protein